MSYDAIVLGLGGMGSAALAHLAARGKRVVGVERFSPVHALGSSHGDSRIIRRAYPLDARYIPLVLRAYELWRDLETSTGTALLQITGGLFVGRPSTRSVRGGIASVRAYDIPHEVLDPVAMRRRFPAIVVRDDELVLYEPGSGIVFPERAILAHLQRAVQHGAEARFGTAIRGWAATPGGGVAVTTARGETIEAAHLVISAGPWFAQVAPELELPLQVERNVVHYFGASNPAAQATLQRLPVYVVERDAGRVYGFPSIPGSGLKIAFYRSYRYVSPDEVERTVDPGEEPAIRAFLTGFIPSAAGLLLRSQVCLYTLTPDEHFVIGLHPKYPQVALAGAFSGHGYKFCSVVGEILADLATGAQTRHPIELFDPQRFRHTAA